MGKPDVDMEDLYIDYYENGNDLDIHKQIDNYDVGQNDEIERYGYSSYPDHYNKDFIFDISRKLEFYHNKSLLNILELQNKCNPSNTFHLTYSQQFLKNFMNDRTPYNGILIFHGVGVGKTCSAVNISSSFRDSYYTKEKQKIICLVSKNIQQSWKDTIYDPDSRKRNNQCSGNSFDNHFDIHKKPTKTKVNRLIKEYYDLFGYTEFANRVKKLIQKRIGSSELTAEERYKVEKDVISSHYSNRVLIIDEVHNLRDEKDTSSEGEEDIKETKDVIRKVIEYSENMKLILLSATPLFNKSTEIVWLMNLLLSNDNRPKLSMGELFEKIEDDYVLNDDAETILMEKTRGYVSYLRGENPISFPIRLYPDFNKDPRCMGPRDSPTKGFNGTDAISPFRFMKLYRSMMADSEDDFDQISFYNSYIESLENKSKLSLSERNIGIQLSNIVYPDETDDQTYEDVYGERGFKQLMNEQPSKYSYKDNNTPIFRLDKLDKLSCKMHTMLSSLRDDKAEGIIFIYTEYIYSGILPIALALEHMGFEKYNNNNLLDYPEWTKDGDPQKMKGKPIDYQWNTDTKLQRAKYIILSGNRDLSPNNDNEIKRVRNENKDGQHIKIIIGNSVTREGIDFKNIREIHILDPWYHLYKIEQVIGRGIRYCSHNEYENIGDRNVTVYNHVAMVEKDTESVDTNTYRIAEDKAEDIGKIENVLKQNAIDGYLNKQVNYIHQLNKIQIMSSRGTSEEADINDQPYTKVCSFNPECKINLHNLDKEKEKSLDKLNEQTIDKDTFSLIDFKDSIQMIKPLIIELFTHYKYYSEEDILREIKENIDTSDIIVLSALNELIRENKILYDNQEISQPGRIIQKNNDYVFQPLINDTSIPIYYREVGIQKRDNKQSLILKDDYDLEIDDDLGTAFMNYTTIYDEIWTTYLRKKSMYELLTNTDGTKGMINNHSSIMNHVIDSLSFYHKKCLLETIIHKKINEEKLDHLEDFIFDTFQPNLIYERKKKVYTIVEHGNPIGFFLHNTSQFFAIQNRQKSPSINDLSFYILADDNWIPLDNIGVREMNKEIIKLKDKYLPPIKGTYGYSFKDEDHKHFVKMVTSKSNMTNTPKTPGKVVGDAGQKSLEMIHILYTYSKDSFFRLNDVLRDQVIEQLKKEKKNVKEVKRVYLELNKEKPSYRVVLNNENYLTPSTRAMLTKHYISLFMELLLRDNHSYMNYDIFPFKYYVS
uniref:Helicase ATP-binding domain-containing protein n=1 Tax=viral metagenome TaxID=1070528 RepID=A0A6C0KYY0_9ZZZZ|tara:strand:- start:27383 stop:31045 length:3663 start_codon:yes stop_codon:yes gene_type:complete